MTTKTLHIKEICTFQEARTAFITVFILLQPVHRSTGYYDSQFQTVIPLAGCSSCHQPVLKTFISSFLQPPTAEKLLQKPHATYIKTSAQLKHSNCIARRALEWTIAKHRCYSNDLYVLLFKQHYDRMSIVYPNPWITVDDHLTARSRCHAILHTKQHPPYIATFVKVPK